MKLKGLYIIFIFSVLGSVQAQDVSSDFNLYSGYSLNFRVDEKLKLKIGNLICFNTDSIKLQYVQSKIGFSYRNTKKVTTSLAFSPMFFKGKTKSIWYQKLSGSLSHSSKLFGFRMKNAVSVEWHFPKLSKYQFRVIYSLKYAFKNKILPMRMTPYITYKLYYYAGGNPLNYYDEAHENIVETNAPNDFHRYRIGGGIRFRPIKHFYISVFYLFQQEFNTTFMKNKQINILNDKQTAIKYPFNDYQGVGISFSYSITNKNYK